MEEVAYCKSDGVLKKMLRKTFIPKFAENFAHMGVRLETTKVHSCSNLKCNRLHFNQAAHIKKGTLRMFHGLTFIRDFLLLCL